MFICLCNGITENQIRSAASAGVDSLNALQEELGVAGQCGQCSDAAVAVLAETLAGADMSAPPLFYSAETRATA